MKIIHLHKRNQSRLLAPWHRESLDFDEHHVVSRVVDRRMVI